MKYSCLALAAWLLASCQTTTGQQSPEAARQDSSFVFMQDDRPSALITRWDCAAVTDPRQAQQQANRSNTIWNQMTAGLSISEMRRNEAQIIDQVAAQTGCRWTGFEIAESVMVQGLVGESTVPRTVTCYANVERPGDDLDANGQAALAYLRLRHNRLVADIIGQYEFGSAEYKSAFDAWLDETDQVMAERYYCT